MATKAEVKALYVKRNRKRLISEVTFGQIASALTDAEKNAILQALRRSDSKSPGKVLMDVTQRVAKAAGEAEADAILADDQISLDEIGGFL